MKAATSTPERQEKLLRLALNPGATEGEAVAAFLKFKRAVIRTGSADVWLSPAAQERVPPFARVVVPFGQYRGQTLAQVLEKDFEYLGWLAGIAREPLRTRVRQTLRWVERGGSR